MAVPVYELTVYDDDDSSELFDVGTDIGHARPYLKAPTSFPEQEVDFAKGTASIGQINLQVVDVPTDATDQDTGYLTAQLAAAAGYSTLNGHRAVLTENIDGGGATTVIDGVIRSVRLLDTFASYEFELRDIRERERKAKAFTNTTTPTVLPRGVLNGYGITSPVAYPIPPTEPLVGTYSSISATQGEIRFADNQPNAQSRQKLIEAVEEAFDSVEPLAAQPEVMIHNRFKVLWRDNVAGGAYTELEQLAFLHPDLPEGGGLPVYMVSSEEGEDSTFIFGLRLNNEVSADTLPSDTQVCDVIVQYDGPPTEDWRHHIQDVNAGELLRNLYRGDHSTEDPRIRYDEAALLLLSTRVRGRLKEPIEDIREWAEKNVYPIVHAAPTLNADGEISPITYLLPDAAESPIALTDANCRPTGGGWSHGAEDAVNLVEVTYKREYRYNPEGRRVAVRRGTSLSDLLIERDVTIEHRIQDSIDLLGEQRLKVDSVLLTTLGGGEGGPYAGDTTLETGYQVAKRIHRMATDRFALGGQYFSLLGDRSDTDVEALVPGSWVTAEVSWMPDYTAQERNLDRLAQVIGRRDRNASWTHLTLVDAGPALAALAAPTLGALSSNAAGVVSIPIASVPAGGECRVDYAVNTTEPAATSELWEFLDRAGVSTLTTPPVGQGEVVWVRARSEATGRRPSAYITAVSTTVAGTPRIIDAFVELDSAGVPRVYWSGNAACLGVRIHYERHLVSASPSFGVSVDVDVADANTILSTIHPVTLGYIFSVQLEPWTGWSGSAVSGSAGDRYEVRVVGSLDLETLPTKPPPYEQLEWYGPLTEGSGVALRDRSGNVRDSAPESSGATLSWVRGVAGMAVDFPGSGVGHELLSDSEAGAIENLFYASCWIKVDDVAGDATARILSRGSGEYFEISIEQDEAFPQDLVFGYSDTQSETIEDVIATAGVWYFILAQWDQTLNIVELWVGSEATGLLERVFRSESLAAFSTATRVLGLGSATTTAPTSSNPFDGSIADVRVGAPDALLTHAEVLSLFRTPGAWSVPATVAPTWEVEFDRDAQGNATLTLTIDDPSGTIVSPGPQFSKRAGSQAGDTWGALSAVWDTEPTNPPYAGAWIEALTVPGGEEAGIRWEYSWIDEDGVTRKHGATHYTAALDENQVELIFPCDNGVPLQETESWVAGPGGRIDPGTINDFLTWIVPIPLPIGVTIEEFDARLYRDATHDTATCELFYGDIDGASSSLAALTGATGGWSTQSNTSVSETVIADRSYHAQFVLRGVDVANDARGAWCRVVYDRQTLEQVY